MERSVLASLGGGMGGFGGGCGGNWVTIYETRGFLTRSFAISDCKMGLS